MHRNAHIQPQMQITAMCQQLWSDHCCSSEESQSHSRWNLSCFGFFPT